MRNKEEMLAKITDAVISALKIKLEPGEICPCCGRKKSKKTMTDAAIAARKANIIKAIAANPKKQKAKAAKCQPSE